jgi:hypothetical protein
MLLCVGCASHQLEKRVTELEKGGKLMPSPAPAPAPRSSDLTWSDLFDALPRGATYRTVVQLVGEPTYSKHDGTLALCLYYVNEAEVYGLFFESGVYIKGFVDTYINWALVLARNSQRAT